MSAFRRELAARQSDPPGRRWVFVPYDQLTAAIGPLAADEPRRLGIVLVENPWKAARRPDHKQKLALVLANLRHFALEQAARGVAVRRVVAPGPYRTGLAPLAAELGPLAMMEAAERELRVDLAPLVARGALRVEPHAGRLTTRAQFHASQSGPPWRMDAFYRPGRPRDEHATPWFDREPRRAYKAAVRAGEAPGGTTRVWRGKRSALQHHLGRASRRDAKVRELLRRGRGGRAEPHLRWDPLAV